MSLTVITPPGRLNMPSWRELWDAREVALRFGQRDLVLRYRQTAIGVIWVLLQPLVSAGVFTIIFGGIAKLPTGEIPYFLFTYVSMLAWNLFSSLTTRSAGSLVGNQALVSKVFFPRIMVPLSTLFSVLVDFLVGLVLATVLCIVLSIGPGWMVLALPLWALLFVLLALGIGFGASALMVKYRDVAYVLPWITQILLFASPVAYSLKAVPANLAWLFQINPLSWLFEGFRSAIIGTPAPPLWQVIGSVGVTVVVFFGGLLIFQSREREFADLI